MRAAPLLLDTNVCIHLLNGDAPELTERLRRRTPSSIRLSTIVQAELLFGARNSSAPGRNLRCLDRFFAPIATVAFDEACAHAYGTLRSELSRRGRPLGPNDLLIAATALAHDLVLATADRAFRAVPELSLEDWSPNG